MRSVRVFAMMCVLLVVASVRSTSVAQDHVDAVGSYRPVGAGWMASEVVSALLEDLFSGLHRFVCNDATPLDKAGPNIDPNGESVVLLPDPSVEQTSLR